MKHKTGGDSEFTRVLLPEGQHVTICYSIIHLGTHTKVDRYSPEGKDNPEMNISFEFPEHRNVYNEEIGEQVMAYHEGFIPYKFHYKSNLCTKLLGPWRNVAIKDGDEIDLNDYIGQALLITIEHYESKTNGKTYERATYSNLPKKMQEMYIKDGTLKPKKDGGYETENEQRILELGEFNQETFNSLPEWMQNKISESKEWPELVKSGVAENIGGTPQAEPEVATSKPESKEAF